jgi:hypothetical protein
VSKLRRGAAVVIAATLAVPLWGVPAASAATATEAASAAGYFSAAGVPDTGTDAGKPPNLTAEADGVAPGNLAVAGGNGAEQKVSFLFFGLDALEIGAEITKAELTVPLVPADSNNVVIAADPAKVRACPAGPEGFGGEHGESITVAPARLCDQAEAPATLSADGKSYVFDITSIAAMWTTANDGVALTTAEGAESTPFQIVFAPGDQAMLAYDATPGLEELAPTVPELGPSTDFDTGDSGTTDFGGGFGGEALPPSDAGFGAVDAPILSEEPAAAAEAPVAADPEVAISQTVPVSVMSESLRPTVAFWLAALLLAAGLALLSLIMGDPRLPQATQRPSRLSQALQAQKAGRRGGLGVRTVTA